MLRDPLPRDPDIEASRESLNKFLMTTHPDLMQMTLDELEEVYQSSYDIFETLSANNPGYDAVLQRLSDCHRVYIRRWARENNARVSIEELLLNYPEEGPSIVRLNAQKAKELAEEYECGKVRHIHAKRHACAYRSLAARLLSLGIV